MYGVLYVIEVPVVEEHLAGVIFVCVDRDKYR